VVWHPAFYPGQNEIKFSKKKVDMLHKDSKCCQADKDFTLTLCLSADASEPSIGSVCELQRLFEEFGEKRTVKPGDELTHFGRELVLITSGIAEAVIREDMGESLHPHPLGFPVPEVGLETKFQERTPVHTVLGAGNVLGAADFFYTKHSFAFRARSAVSARVLRSGQSAERLFDIQCPKAKSPNPSSNRNSNSNVKAEGLNAAPPGPTKRAWVVKKRLNMLQNDWRCLEVDGTQRVIYNKKITDAFIARLRLDGVPEISQTELLAMSSQLRKTLQFDDLATIIQHSEASKRITIRFRSAHAPYQIEFVSNAELDDFLAYLRIHLQQLKVRLNVFVLSSCANLVLN
jgi:hypothetical protein